MKILIAPDSFKGSLSAEEVAKAMARGISRLVSGNPASAVETLEVDLVPVADGGEGTVDCLVTAMSGQYVKVPVHDPLGRPIEAAYGVLPGGTAVIEMAAASGLTLVDPLERDIRQANTYGVGQLILDALSHGYRTFIIGIGGSATNDAGVGMLSALGMRFYNAYGQELPPTPEALLELHRVDTTELTRVLQGATFRVASDVTNPLCGAQGASAVFGPQKGASQEDVGFLDAALTRFADVVEQHLGRSFRDVPGAGAAGGLGAALYGVMQAELVKGIDLVLNVVNFDERLKGADLVLTGEGQTDFQTVHGKVVAGIARRAVQVGVPVFCLSGAVAEEARELYQQGVNALFALPRGPLTLAQSMEHAADLLESGAESAVRAFLAGYNEGLSDAASGFANRSLPFRITNQLEEDT